MHGVSWKCVCSFFCLSQNAIWLVGRSSHVPEPGQLVDVRQRRYVVTAALDSEGTLGRLIGLGVPEQLGRHLDRFLDRMHYCTSDPLCAEHVSLQDHALHKAAYHACLFLPETSCEHGNKYLGRSVLVPTVDRTHLAFFESLV
jgi:hypothetical protein